jgi:hypothetical protein
VIVGEIGAWHKLDKTFTQLWHKTLKTTYTYYNEWILSSSQK